MCNWWSIGVSLSICSLSDNGLFRFATDYYNKRYSAIQASFRAMLSVFMPSDAQVSPYPAFSIALRALFYIEVKIFVKRC